MMSMTNKLHHRHHRPRWVFFALLVATSVALLENLGGVANGLVLNHNTNNNQRQQHRALLFPTAAFTSRLTTTSTNTNLRMTATPSTSSSIEDIHDSIEERPPSLQELLTEEAYCIDISKKVASRISLPFVCPYPVVVLATRLVIQGMASNVSPTLVRRIGDFINRVSEEDVTDLADEIANQINPNIDIPVLTEEQEEIVLEQVIKLVLKELAKNKKIKVNPKKLMDQSITTTQTLLGEEAGRRKLAKMLNAKVDFPFMNEEQEEELWMKTLDGCADKLQELLPPQLIEVLKGETEGGGKDGIEKTKAFVVQQLNERLDIVGLSEKQEEWLLNNFVGTVLDVLLENTETELFLMNPEEQKEELEQRRAVLVRDLRNSKIKFEQQQAFMKGKLERVEERLSGLE